jgi:hypothetical protein
MEMEKNFFTWLSFHLENLFKGVKSTISLHGFHESARKTGTMSGRFDAKALASCSNNLLPILAPGVKKEKLLKGL